MVLNMKRRMVLNSRSWAGVLGLVAFLCLADCPRCVAVEPAAAAVSAFNAYVRGVEGRLARQHQAPNGFLVLDSGSRDGEARLRRGELVVEKLTPSDWSSDGAMLHDWRGTAFAPGATAGDFERLMRGFDGYPKHFAPQVVRAKVVGQQGDDLRVVMRVRQKHVITVVMDIHYDFGSGLLDGQRGWNSARGMQIDEIADAGTKRERVLSGAEEHGFLWRLNTYWSYEERDGGLWMQIESVSLTRSIPRGLGWAVGPFVESVPRESMEFTLRSVCNALRK
jgi:hypothetical protein